MAATGSQGPGDTDLAAWIGRRCEAEDVLDDRLIAEFTATLSPYLAAAARVPPGLFWCLAPEIRALSELAGDGHPRQGNLLPEAPFPHRMWAGGELLFLGEFEPGDMVTKACTIEDIAFKSGRTGKLCFVVLRNHYSARRQLILDERQDLVFRQGQSNLRGAGADSIPVEAAPPPAKASGSWVVTPTPALLFRYSAMTFNGHRIHYDHPYATRVEGYAGLVVHGPLQATLMLNLAVATLGRLPRRFAYRGLMPLICDRPFAVSAVAGAEGGLETRITAGSGVTTMSGRAE